MKKPLRRRNAPEMGRFSFSACANGGLSRGQFLAGTAAAMLGSSLAMGGCARAARNAPLRVWSFNHFEGYEALLQSQLAAFERLRPGFTTTYEIISWAEEDDKLTVAMASGRPPDVLWGAIDARWIASGLQIPVDAYLTPADRADFFPSALDAMRYGRQLWGFPLYQTMYCMAGNAALLEDARIDWRAIQARGWTWDQFVGDCRRVQKSATYPFVFFTHPTAELWSWFALNNGVTDANSDGLRADGTFGWQRAQVQSSLQFLVDSFRVHRIAPEQEPAFTDENQTDLFFQGKAAVSARQGPYVITEQQRIDRALRSGSGAPHAGYQRFPVVLLPFPHNPPARQLAHAGGGGYMVFQQKNVDDQRRIEAAMQLAHFLSGTAGMIFAARLSLLPSRRSGIKVFGKQLNLGSPNMQFFQNYLRLAAPRVHPPVDVAATRESRVAEVAIMPNWEAALSGDKTPQQAVRDMAQAANAVLSGT